MRIPIDYSNALPHYRQIKGFLREQIKTGALPINTKVPANRKLAEMIDGSRIVLLNGYAGLESHGLVYGRRGSGTLAAPIYFSRSGGKTP